MNAQSNTLVADVQSKLRAAKSLCLDLLLPTTIVEQLCAELGHKFRVCTYTPSLVVWMFITQVLAADHSCQQAVTRLNTWRVARDDKAFVAVRQSPIMEAFFERFA